MATLRDRRNDVAVLGGAEARKYASAMTLDAFRPEAYHLAKGADFNDRPSPDQDPACPMSVTASAISALGPSRPPPPREPAGIRKSN
jgi:hypothetical protein